MSKARIRPLAMCIFRRGDKILAAEHFDTATQLQFYRPVGGGIEFGEYAADAVVREISEELHAKVHDVRFLFVLENIFTYQDKPGHEIAFVFDARFTDETLYAQPVLQGDENGSPFRAVWLSVQELHSSNRPLYPRGLLERLMEL